MKAIEIQKLTVKCDDCDFNQDIPIDTFKDWHYKKCPDCSAILVDDSDIAQFEAMVSLADIVNEVAGDLKDGHSVTFAHDSAAIK